QRRAPAAAPPARALRGAAVRRLDALADGPRARALEPGGAPGAPPAPRRARHGAPAPRPLPARGVLLHRDRNLADPARRARGAGRADLHGERAGGFRDDAARALAPPALPPRARRRGLLHAERGGRAAHPRPGRRPAAGPGRGQPQVRRRRRRPAARRAPPRRRARRAAHDRGRQHARGRGRDGARGLPARAGGTRRSDAPPRPAAPRAPGRGGRAGARRRVPARARQRARDAREGTGARGHPPRRGRTAGALLRARGDRLRRGEPGAGRRTQRARAGARRPARAGRAAHRARGGHGGAPDRGWRGAARELGREPRLGAGRPARRAGAPGRPGTARALRAALAPAALAYGAVAALRNRLYDAGWLDAARVPAHVVSVGNLAVGGTGKTPTALWLAERLAARGLRTGIVARGYRKRRRGVVIVGEKGRPLVGPEEGGDEAVLLARRFAGPVVSGERRAEAAAVACARFALDALVLDDGRLGPA